jgi:hypothetical protein
VQAAVLPLQLRQQQPLQKLLLLPRLRLLQTIARMLLQQAAAVRPPSKVQLQQLVMPKLHQAVWRQLHPQMGLDLMAALPAPSRTAQQLLMLVQQRRR